MTDRLTTKVDRRGVPITTVRIFPGEKAVIVRDDSYYRLGGQLDDVVQSHVLQECVPVYWCSIEQKWVERGGLNTFGNY